MLIVGLTSLYIYTDCRQQLEPATYRSQGNVGAFPAIKQ
jgi:hypothetical protein